MSIDDYTIKPRERETIDELLSLQSQFAMLAGFIEGMTVGREDTDTVRKGALSDLMNMLHGMKEWKRIMAARGVKTP